MKRIMTVFITTIFCVSSSYNVIALGNLEIMLKVISAAIRLPYGIEEDNIEMTDKAKAYAVLFDGVYNVDPGLSSNIKYISFVTSTFEDFSDKDKTGFFEYISNKYNVEILEKDYEQLKEEGYIVGKEMYFEDGILFKINNYYENSDKCISAEVFKWRSGLGANWIDTKVIKENDTWILKNADMTAIS